MLLFSIATKSSYSKMGLIYQCTEIVHVENLYPSIKFNFDLITNKIVIIYVLLMKIMTGTLLLIENLTIPGQNIKIYLIIYIANFF